jgi:hypothetical protein
METFGPAWHKRLTPLARRTVDARVASQGLRIGEVKEIRTTAGEAGCVLVIFKRGADGKPAFDRAGLLTEERSFADRPAVLR